MSDDLGAADEVMTSSRPYMVRAIHAWISDNGLTPYIVVDATQPLVTVPLAHVNEGKIVLNCSYDAVSGLSIENDWISFSARFSGASEEISFPSDAVRAIYARENGQGMVFPEEEQGAAESQSATALSEAQPEMAEQQPSKAPEKRGKPSLKIVK